MGPDTLQMFIPCQIKAQQDTAHSPAQPRQLKGHMHSNPPLLPGMGEWGRGRLLELESGDH